jgi:beta-lactamase regulating signal transducer with metallopeptidase domain
MSESILLSHPLAYTLGLTLLHSIWQGVIIAASLALLLHLYRACAAHLRYVLSVAAMLSWLVLAAGTFGYLLGFSKPGPAEVTYIEAGQADSFSLSGMIESHMDPAVVLPWFMLFWLSGVLFMSLRTAAGLFGVTRLKRHGLAPLPGPWQAKIAAWFKAWGAQQQIPVFLSQHVQAPVVAGFFKQTLLLPISFLTAFPPEQIEAILAHEAAHFLRRDALINLVQSFMETLFFYHPAIWWISARIRDEREYSCDDYAVAKCGCPLNLARALVDMQDRRTDGIMPVPVLSATGRLQTRITRLFDRKENSMEMREKLLVHRTITDTNHEII